MNDDSTKLDLNDHLMHQQWLLKHGFINDLHKDNLFAYGSLIHSKIEAVYVKIEPDRKVIGYEVYVSKNLLKSLAKYEKLKDSDSIFGLFRLKRLIKKEGNLNFNFLLNKFVKDYCGSDWTAELEILDVANYKDDLDYEKEEDQRTGSTDDN